MLENLNLVTMLLVAVVVGALFGVTWYVSSRSGEEPVLRQNHIPRQTEMSPEDRFRDFCIIAGTCRRL
jgi:hypothetical protein